MEMDEKREALLTLTWLRGVETTAKSGRTVVFARQSNFCRHIQRLW